MVHHIILILGMSSGSCVTLVRLILSDLCIASIAVNIGEVILSQCLSSSQKEKFREQLKLHKFILYEKTDELASEEIKIYLHQWMADERNTISETRAEYLVMKLKWSEDTISRVFQKAEGITIGKYCKRYKVERAKLFLETTPYTPTEIAYLSHFKSTQYYCNQFKNSTTLTSTAYRNRAREGT